VERPDSDIDWLRTMMATNHNYQRWSEDAELQASLDNARLNLAGYWSVRLPSDPSVRADALRQRRVTT
jgi:hypothetical protein